MAQDISEVGAPTPRLPRADPLPVEPSLHPPRELDTAAVYRTEIARLRAEVRALEAEVEREERRRQAIVRRYERLLDERNRECERDARTDGGLARDPLLDRLLAALR